jgi:hypothetical protein
LFPLTLRSGQWSVVVVEAEEVGEAYAEMVLMQKIMLLLLLLVVVMMMMISLLTFKIFALKLHVTTHLHFSYILHWKQNESLLLAYC